LGLQFSQSSQTVLKIGKHPKLKSFQKE